MENKKSDNSSELVELSAEIVSAYVSHNVVPATEVPALIESVFRALEETQSGQPDGKTSEKPAVPFKRSVTDDYIICLEDGKKFKSLKRHLRTHFGLTPEQYRQKWGLPVDYPMVAPNYAAARSALAKQMGLGQLGGRRKRS